MKKTYLKIDFEHRETEKTNPNFFVIFLEKILVKISNAANPDFDNQIHKTDNWLIEFDEFGIPEREIGLDKDGKTVMIMPWKDNYGYFTDNNFKLQDFKNGFSYSEIERDYFEQEWKQFNENNL